jgi:pilus assembly protein TadC
MSAAAALACAGVTLTLVGGSTGSSGVSSGCTAARVATWRPTGNAAVATTSGTADIRDHRSSRRPRTVAGSVALGVATALVLGGVLGIAAGTAAAIGAHRVIGVLEPAEMRRIRERRAAELPLMLDLLAVCLRAGMPLVGALEAVAEALGGPFSADLSGVAGLLRLGSPSATAWTGLSEDPDLAAVARAAGRSAESGSRLATSFERLAAERRTALVAAGETTARKAGVTAMAPLALCFLPAFVCLGLVPIVLSLAVEVLP